MINSSTVSSEFAPIFGSSGNVPASHEDIVHCYNFILGRHPENVAIFREALGQPVHAIMKDMLASEEFGRVRSSLAAGNLDKHLAISASPTETLLLWLNKTIAIDGSFARSILLVKSWAELLNLIVELPEVAALLDGAPSSDRVATSSSNRSPEAAPLDKLICVLEECSPNRVAGWATYQGCEERLVSLSFTVDDVHCADVECNLPQDDKMPRHAPGHCGFKFQLSRQYFDGKKHQLRVKANGEAVAFEFRGAIHFEHTFCGAWLAPPQSFVDGFDGGVIRGWLLRQTQFDAELSGNRTVQVTCGGEVVAVLKANRFRPDVAEALRADAYCGFVFEPPFELKRSRPMTFHFYDVEDGTELANSPCSTSFGKDHRYGKLLALQDVVDRLSADIEGLKQDIRSIVSRRQYSIYEYDLWFDDYIVLLRDSVSQDRIHRQQKTRAPLVSIIYSMPGLNGSLDEGSIASAIEQTYSNWELIVVVDGSDDELAAGTRGLASRENRIKLVRIRRNGTAINTAIAAASGEWITFLSHGDLLVDVALEVMVFRASETNALMAYSDEDKSDALGRFSDPRFKPDWNYRLLLSCNYISHLLLIKRSEVLKVGKLRKKYAGAQEHDLLLRLSERLKEQDIVHISDVLYHSKAASPSVGGDGSRAASLIVKECTTGGIAAITDHLVRRGCSASVGSISHQPMYSIEFQAFWRPLVHVIIPFRDEPMITTRCVEAVLGLTKYEEFRITLVDNMSARAETKAMVERFCKDPRVECLAFEEEFNFSKLNNLAATRIDSDFIFFMNNDLIVADGNWLDIVVGEAQLSPEVGAVGGKFLYPNGSVQHAGVILGLWGLAGHVHKGIPGDAAGFCARANLAHEVSAVTAAGMLVRTTAFKQVGMFDEQNLKVAFNDIDLCLKLREAGYKIIWTPEFLAEHHESLSRGRDDKEFRRQRSESEIRYMHGRWGKYLNADPFYSPCFDLHGEPFVDLRDPRELHPVRS